MERFKYKQPASLAEVNRLSAQNFQDNLILAGGTDLLGLIKDKIEQPKTLLNLKAVDGLKTIDYKKGQGLKIGTLVNIAAIAEHPLIREKFTVLAEAAAEVASPQLRNMGTLGGNLCQRPRCWYFRGEFDCLRKGGDVCFAVDGENKYHCVIGGDPCFIVHPSDLAVALLALSAGLTIFSDGKTRTVPIDKFFVLPEKDVLRENILKPGEVITEVFVPDSAKNSASTYLKFKERASWDFAIVSVAAVIRMKDGKIDQARVSLGGVAPVPWLENSINNGLKNISVSRVDIERVVKAALVDADALEKNGYKIILARNLIKKALNKLIA